MLLKRILVSLSTLFLILLFVMPVSAQLQSVVKFKGVEIPYNLKHEDTLIEIDKYDFEIFVLEHDAQKLFFLGIKKGKKVLCHIPGERLQYETEFLMELDKDPNIPDKSTLDMRIAPQEKSVIFIFEAGKRAGAYSYEKIRFKIEYIL